MKTTYVVSSVNPDPSLQGNALFGWTETSSFGELKRKRGGGATASIAVITPSSIHDSDYPKTTGAGENEKINKTREGAYRGAA